MILQKVEETSIKSNAPVIKSYANSETSKTLAIGLKKEIVLKEHKTAYKAKSN